MWYERGISFGSGIGVVVGDGSGVGVIVAVGSTDAVVVGVGVAVGSRVAVGCGPGGLMQPLMRITMITARSKTGFVFMQISKAWLLKKLRLCYKISLAML